MGPPPRPEPLLVSEEDITKVMEQLDKVQLSQQEIKEESKRLWRKRSTKEAEKERVTRQLEQLHEERKLLHEQMLVLKSELQQLRLWRQGQ